MSTDGVSTSEFEAAIRENRELLAQMAEREGLDVDSHWMRILRGTAQILMYLVTFFVVAVAVWLIGWAIISG